MDIWLDVANVFYLVSYLVTDILWLRALSIFGGFAYLTWALLQPHLGASVIAWTVVFNAINLVQAARLVLARRPVRLTPDEQRLYAQAFRTLTPREFRRLLGLGQWELARAGQVLVEQGAPPERVLVLSLGQVAVIADGRLVATLGGGQFVGEMGFLTDRPTTAAIQATEMVRYVAFPVRPLRTFLGKNPALRSALQTLIGQDLVAKLAPAPRASA